MYVLCNKIDFYKGESDREAIIIKAVSLREEGGGKGSEEVVRESTSS